MSEEKIREIVNFLRDFLRTRHINIQKIILFGSYAKKKFSEESDVDLAIISKDFEGKDIFQRAEMLKGLIWAMVRRFRLPFDIVPVSLQEWENSHSLAVAFIREGKEIYA